MIGACCVLHNICEAADEVDRESWEQTGTVQQEWKKDYAELTSCNVARC